MTVYRLCKDTYGNISSISRDDGWNIPFDPANTDYQRFKYEINNDEAGLEDADGVLMTPEEAKAYVATLP